MSRYDRLKKSLASPSEHHRRRGSPTFMEFVHRQEERLESHIREMKKKPTSLESVEPPSTPQTDHYQPDNVDISSEPLINMFDLLLAGTLMFAFITMLLLFMN